MYNLLGSSLVVMKHASCVVSRYDVGKAELSDYYEATRGWSCFISCSVVIQHTSSPWKLVSFLHKETVAKGQKEGELCLIMDMNDVVDLENFM